MWTEEDTEAALAWQDMQDATCKGCGNPLDESMDPENERAYKAKALVCHGCKAVQLRARADQENQVNPAGRMYIATKEG